jgi:hypothetical protein
MDASNMQIVRLDLATRAIDLTTALLEATTSSGSLLKGAWEIGQWLGRERLNQYELLDCMQKAKGLVFANKKGQQFFDQIIRGLDTVPVGPLFLRQSGSLGRLMAGDPNLSWIVSTVACLFQHHRDDRVVTETLTAFIMDSHRSRGQEQDLSTLDAFIYSPEQTRVRAVVRKIVSSVWYNVVNVGCDTIPLPQELLSVCPKGHYLDPGDFGIVINTIHAHCPSKAILRTNHLLRDVLLWLLLHYDGTIVVNVGGQIVYRADLGNPHRELEVHVASACPEDSDCGTAGQESYKILRHISGKFEEFLSGYSFSGFTDLPPRPGVRQKLYDVPRPYPSDSAMWNKGLQILVKCSAQSIMQWLLDVPLSAQTDCSSPGFSAQPGQQAAANQMTVSLALKRVPAMINLQWGSWPASQVIFVGRPQDSFGSGILDENTTWNTERRLNILLECFPVLADLVTKVSADCLCSDCSGHKRRHLSDVRTNRLRLGCLKRTAMEEAFLLLAHGLADGFGVSDASSVSDVSPIVEGMAVLLLELVQERKVCWDTWFAVASCIYLGCPFEKPVPHAHPAFGGTAFAAIQYGNLATQAPWLDLTQDHAVRGCFGLIGSRGRLGMITRSDDQHAQFRSVEENFAIIETENTEDTTSFSSRYKKAASLIDHRLHMDEDESCVESDVILCQIDDKFYRLLLRIKTNTHWRVVDPSDALSAMIRMLPSTTCQHRTQPPEMSPLTAKIYTMDEVLGRWPNLIQSHVSTTTASGDTTQIGRTFHLTHVLDTHLKKNIALALSVCPIAVPNYPEFACPTCTLSYARKAERQPLREGESGNSADRYIINLRTQLAEQEGAMRRLLIEGSNVPTEDGLPTR